MKVSKKCVSCNFNKAGNCTLQKLEEHSRRIHAMDSGWEWCSQCNKSIRCLKKHLESSIHSTERTFNCEICGHMYGTQLNLRRHIKITHDKTAFPCPICEKVFYWHETRRELLLKEHIAIVHEGSKPFVCEICGTKMSKYSNLDDHRIKVHGEKRVPIATYREMIESGKYKYLVDLPSNLNCLASNIPTNWFTDA